MEIAEYRKQVKEQLELLGRMRNALSPDNILKDILTELHEVGELALGETPRVFFKFVTVREGIDEEEEDLCSPLYQGREPWGALVRCVKGNIILLVNALTRASCFLSYSVPDTSYLPPKYMNNIKTHSKWFEPFFIPDHLDISAYELQNPGVAPPLRIPDNILRLHSFPSGLKIKYFCNADAEQFLEMNRQHFMSWIHKSLPGLFSWSWTTRDLPELDRDHPLYSRKYTESYSRKMRDFMILHLGFLDNRFTNTTRGSNYPTGGVLYDSSINVLLIYMSSISLPRYPAYDEENRSDAPLRSTVTLKPTVPITPNSIRQWQTFGTIKPMPSVAHNPAKLRENLEKNEITMKIMRDLLAELAKEAYMRRRFCTPIKAEAKPVILSVDEIRQKR